MRRVRWSLVAVVLSVASGQVVVEDAGAGSVLPAGFSDSIVAAVAVPTALDFTPDGRLLATSQTGAVRVVKGGSLLGTPALDLAPQLCSDGERGLLGVAVDPEFVTNHFVFLYYTARKGAVCDGTAVNRVSRFVMSGDTLGGETVLINNIPSPNAFHNGGDVEFGKDSLLYVSVGDGGCDYPGGTPSGCGPANDASRDLNVLVGKVLRVDRDGAIPAGNPFQGAGTARCNVMGVVSAGLICQETFSSGLRNPFRIAFDPNDAGTRFYINDVGQDTWEEIDLGTAGADYGWNVREGHCANGSTEVCGSPPAGMTNPIFDYGHTDGCTSITAGAFVPAGLWPPEYQGKYLFADPSCGKLFRLDPAGPGFTRTEFATVDVGSVVSMRFGPWRGTQALYYVSYANGGQVRRIVHPAGTTPGDYDRDGDAEIAVFRPSNSVWYVQGVVVASFGTSGDVPVPADYDGDGATDIAVFRPSNGVWYVQGAPGTAVPWGGSGDVATPADYNGDGDAELAVFRPSNGVWYVQGITTAPFGTSGDVPVPGDYDGDGDTDIAVFRPSNQVWYVLGGQSVQFGAPGDVPVPADYDGDGDTDIAVFRPSTGFWSVRGEPGTTVEWGTSGDVPSPGDYDGDGDGDIAVFRPSTGLRYVRGGSPAVVAWGAMGDIPMPRATPQG